MGGGKNFKKKREATGCPLRLKPHMIPLVACPPNALIVAITLLSVLLASLGRALVVSQDVVEPAGNCAPRRDLQRWLAAVVQVWFGLEFLEHTSFCLLY